MTVLVGHSTRASAPPRALHLVTELAGQQVMACSGSPAIEIRQVPGDPQAVYDDLGCGSCRRMWKRVVNIPRRQP